MNADGSGPNDLDGGGTDERVRPRLELLTAAQCERIVDQAIDALGTVGVLVENAAAEALLRAEGQRFEAGRAYLDEALVRRAIASAPRSFTVYDRDGAPAIRYGVGAVHFDPGSSALHVLDRATRRARRATAADCVELAWVAEACPHIASQSTAVVPSDVPDVLADRYRLFVALQNGRKPVVTGTFRKDGFAVMRDLLAAVRGGEDALAARPLAVFDCCPTPPLAWSDLTAQALVDCARAGIPAQLVSMPLGGATAPVTLREMVVQHAAESLSGIVIHQLARSGAPIVYGGAPAAFDMRHGTTPMGAIETMMVDLSYAQVGRHIGLPTHAYMALSDAKTVDWQAGAETAVGAVLAALGGVDLVSGPGALDFVNCMSAEKLVLDDEACGLALRLREGVAHDSAGEAVALLGAVVAEGHFLKNRHTRKNFRRELHFPGRVIDRAPYETWDRNGARDAWARAHAEVDAILARGNPAPLADDVTTEIRGILSRDAARLGLSLP